MKFKNFLLSCLLLSPLLFSSAHGQTSASGDLVLPDARYQAAFSHYICRFFEDDKIAQPTELNERGVVFEKLMGDGMVIDFLITASFKEKNSVCHYSAILSRAVVRNALVKTKSKAYSDDEGVDCSQGQAQLDALFVKSSYAYTTKPIRFISLKIPSLESAAGTICDADANGGVRVVFERIRN